MEVPRFWRTSPTRTGFRTETTVDSNNRPDTLRYPWGDISLSGGMEEVQQRLLDKGFNEKAVEEILFSVFGGVATEATITAPEVVDGLLKFLRSEVREENGRKV